jgi:hypothetical protein
MRALPWEDATLAANGRPVSENFAPWFGKSRAVDDAGVPLTLFHSTTEVFDAFDLERSFDGGIHFGTPQAANKRLEYWLDGVEDAPAHVIPVYLSVLNPKVIDYDPYSEDEWGKLIWEARQAGFDGIRYPNKVEGGESWCVFSTGQVKSAMGNSGLYAPGPSLCDADEEAETECVLNVPPERPRMEMR